MMSMLHHIWTDQICLAGKILHGAEKGNYCRQILEEQVCIGCEGLAKEAGDICQKVGLPDVRRVDIPS